MRLASELLSLWQRRLTIDITFWADGPERIQVFIWQDHGHVFETFLEALFLLLLPFDFPVPSIHYIIQIVI